MPLDGGSLDIATKLLIEGRAAVERGWCQGECEKDGAVCMTGALGWRSEFSLGWGDWETKVSPGYSAALRRLKTVVGSFDERGIPAWNDAPERTKEEVLAAFDRAIGIGV